MRNKRKRKGVSKSKKFCRGKGAASKGAIYYVTITTVISSSAKRTCYLHVWRYEVFAEKLTWHFTGVYIIKKDIFLKIRMALKPLITESQSIQANRKCTYAVSQKESGQSY